MSNKRVNKLKTIRPDIRGVDRMIMGPHSLSIEPYYEKDYKMSRTHDEVVEAHRIKIGADRVHVSYNPDCDPEELAKALDDANNYLDMFHSIDPITKLEAEVDRLRNLIREVSKLSRTNIADFSTQSEEVFELKGKFFALVEMQLYDQPSYTIEFAKKKGVL